MPKGDKSKYTDKQKRQAEHIENSYKDQGATEDMAERIAWATVNKTSGGGKKGGSGMKSESKSAGKSASTRSRSEAAKKGWETRRRNQR